MGRGADQAWIRETEIRDSRYDGIEELPTTELLSALLEGQNGALLAVSHALEELGSAVDAAADRLRGTDGRLAYAGAGTSGRLAVLDGVELTPTFGWPASRLVFLLAGGLEAMMASVEGAEDDADAAREVVANAGLGRQDVMVALAASGGTPFTCAAAEAAREAGALTITFSNNPGAPLLACADHGILLRSGPEVLAGSTRMGAGTAQKAALNLFSTSLMARLHKIHAGYMVDMLATNAKLKARAEAMVAKIGGVELEVASKCLMDADNNIKVAVLLAKGGSLGQALRLLEDHQGHLRSALDNL